MFGHPVEDGVGPINELFQLSSDIILESQLLQGLLQLLYIPYISLLQLEGQVHQYIPTANIGAYELAS